MNGIIRKLKEMESNCVGKVPTTETYLAFSEFPEAEQQMHRWAFQIWESHNKEIDDFSEKAKHKDDAIESYSGFSDWEEQVVTKSTIFLLYRIDKLYLDKLLIPARDSLQKLVISSRFHWFLQQLNLFLEQINKEDSILGNKTISDEERDLQLKKLYETWVRPFTPDTWDKYWNENIEPKLSEAIKDMPDEEGN